MVALVLSQSSGSDRVSLTILVLPRTKPSSVPKICRKSRSARLPEGHQALIHLDRTEEAIGALQHGSKLIDPRKALAKPDYDALRGEEPFRDLIRYLSASEDNS